MKITRPIVIGAAIVALGLTGVTAYAYYERTGVTETTPVATPDPNLAMPSSAPSTAPATHDKKAMLGDVIATASSYLGIGTSDLKTALGSGKSLADIANATAGKSRDGLVAALTAAADQKIDAQVTAGSLTAQQAAAAKQKSAKEIAKLVDRVMNQKH